MDERSANSITVPTPSPGHSAETQVGSPNEPKPGEPSQPFRGLEIADRLQGLAVSHPRQLGGEISASLIAGTFLSLSNELAMQRRDNEHLTERLEKAQKETHEAQVSVAVLTEKYKSQRRAAIPSQIAVFIGTGLLAYSIDLFKSGLTAQAAVFCCLGIGALVASRFLGSTD